MIKKSSCFFHCFILIFANVIMVAVMGMGSWVRFLGLVEPVVWGLVIIKGSRALYINTQK